MKAFWLALSALGLEEACIFCKRSDLPNTLICGLGCFGCWLIAYLAAKSEETKRQSSQ